MSTKKVTLKGLVKPIDTKDPFNQNKAVTKLEAIHYCLDGLIIYKAMLKEYKKLYLMRSNIEKMLKKFEGVTHVQ